MPLVTLPPYGTWEYVTIVPSPGKWPAWRIIITQVNLQPSSIFLQFTWFFPSARWKRKWSLKVHINVCLTGSGKLSKSTWKHLSDILKSDCHRYTLNVFHSFAICPISLLQISHVKVNLLYAKSKTKHLAAFCANVLGRQVTRTGTEVKNKGKPRSHGRAPAWVWELCSASLAFSREIWCLAMDLVTAVWRRPSGSCGKSKIHLNRVWSRRDFMYQKTVKTD